MGNEGIEKIYFYDNEYYSLEEISAMYKKLAEEQKKGFKDNIAHFILAEILKKCNYDERITDGVLELAQLEASIISMYGSDCGTPMLALRGLYSRNLRKLLNLTGKLADRDDSRINLYNNGEWLLKNLVCLTLGSSYEKDIIDDLELINYDSLSNSECQAIADNFIRNMRGEDIVFYNGSRQYRKE